MNDTCDILLHNLIRVVADIWAIAIFVTENYFHAGNLENV